MAFSEDLARLCSTELRTAKGDEDRIAEMIERLTHSLSWTIALVSGGDHALAAKLLAGVDAHIGEMTTGGVKTYRTMTGQQPPTAT